MVEDEDNHATCQAAFQELAKTPQDHVDQFVKYGENFPLLTTDVRLVTRRVFISVSTARDEEEIKAWSEDELQGICCQELRPKFAR